MSKVSVLIVEDDENIRKMYSDAFSNAGVAVYTASNGTEGVALALSVHPNAILMDIMMPGMSGHEAINKIRRDAWGKHAKVIYLTNMSDAENIVHAVAQGSDEYIVKSNTTPTEVVKQVRTHMRG